MNAVSLRARLLAGIVGLTAIALVAAALVTYEEQRSFLLNRVGQQVQSALVPLSFQLRIGGRPGGAGALRFALPGRRRFTGPLGLRADANLPPGTFGELLGPGGTVLRRRTFSYGGGVTSPPRLPTHVPLSTSGAPLRLFTVSARGGSDLGYRAAAFTAGGDTVVVAVPLREVDDTLHRLVAVEALVGGAVIVALLLLGWIVIRIGLRPLERIGRVASEIAGGDLSRRVAPADPRTEVGRLGQSLNEMLGQIERAFADREHSEERLRSFLADASHELRTPLSSIRGYAELFRLGATEDPDTLARAMARIEEEAIRMGALVEELLLLAQLDQAPRPRQEPVDLPELVRQAADDAAVIAPERDIVVSAAPPATVLGDPDQLRRLLDNLLRNAVMHTPAATSIELGLATDGGVATLSVRDHGPGLPPDAGEQLFERFWRSESGRRRGPGGAGLGLAIVRAIARAHGGEVQALAAPGGGALMRVTLPLAPGAANGSQETLSPLTVHSYLDRTR
jgi:two-component system OmpR family sensor kinase